MKKNDIAKLLREVRGEPEPQETDRTPDISKGMEKMVEKMTKVLEHSESVLSKTNTDILQKKVDDFSKRFDFFLMQIDGRINETSMSSKNLINNEVASIREELKKLKKSDDDAKESVSYLENEANEGINSLENRLDELSDSLDELSTLFNSSFDETTQKNERDSNILNEKYALLLREIEAMRLDGQETGKETKTLSEYYKQLDLDLKKKLKDVYEFGIALQVLSNSANIAQVQGINFKGAGVSVSTNVSSPGYVDVTIAASSVTILPATGTVDNSNVTFTFTKLPVIIYVNGNGYRQNHGWTWNAGLLQATLESPVGNGGDIYGI